MFTSLVAWLCAKRAGGRIVLRIEDLDRARCKRDYADSIMRDFERLGLTWDNEQVVWQGDRTEAYETAYRQLEERGLLYPCFCSRADLHSASAPHHGEKFVYAGTCRHLTESEKAERALTRNPAWRLRVDGAPEISIDDLFQGTYAQCLMRDCGDFIVRRSDGIFAYQLAVVVDDLFQGVNQVVRGQDLLDSAPQQVYLRHLLAPDAPQYTYGHVPLFVDSEGRRLSKRNRDVNLDGLLCRYASVEGLFGAIAGACGIMPSDDPVSLDELMASADLSALRGCTRIVWELRR
ncbi:MAG: glutamate--tRNA ligase family protein [Eggerthellaceae bacterium]